MQWTLQIYLKEIELHSILLLYFIKTDKYERSCISIKVYHEIKVVFLKFCTIVICRRSHGNGKSAYGVKHPATE